MNYFDLGVFIVVGLSALLSFYRGLVREVLSLGGWIVASVVTLKYLDPATELMKHQIKSEALAVAIAAIALFVGTLIGLTILTNLIVKFIKPGDKMGLMDNLGGLVFGLARGALIVGIGFLVFSKLITDTDKYPKMVKQAITLPYVQEAAEWVSELSPEYLEKTATDVEKTATHGLKKASAALGEKKDDAEETLEKKPYKIPSLQDLQDRMEEKDQ